jgi:hypothetical protein
MTSYYEALETIAKYEFGMKKAQRYEDAVGIDASVRNKNIISYVAELVDL